MNQFTPYLPEIVCVAGLIIYLVASDVKPRIVEIGKLMFFTGLLATLIIGVHL